MTKQEAALLKPGQNQKLRWTETAKKIFAGHCGDEVEFQGFVKFRLGIPLCHADEQGNLVNMSNNLNLLVKTSEGVEEFSACYFLPPSSA